MFKIGDVANFCRSCHKSGALIEYGRIPNGDLVKLDLCEACYGQWRKFTDAITRTTLVACVDHEHTYEYNPRFDRYECTVCGHFVSRWAKETGDAIVKNTFGPIKWSR